LASPLVAEKKGIPWVSAMHLPIGLASGYDPPVLPGFVVLSKTLRFLGPAFWVPLRRFLTWATNCWAKPWYRLREEIGLPPSATVNPLTDGQSPLLHLALFSPRIMDKQSDWPPQTLVTGFPWYDRQGEGKLPAELTQFLDERAPPLVFTLGTAIAEDAGAAGFFAASAVAAKLLGRRAVLILNEPRNRPPVLPEGVLAVDYAPFSELFPRAAVIVHHGGSERRGSRCGRGGRCLSCRARGTSRTTPSVLPGWASPARLLAAATPRPALPPSCAACSTTQGTPSGRRWSAFKCGKKMGRGLLVTLFQDCSRRPAQPGGWRTREPAAAPDRGTG